MFDVIKKAIGMLTGMTKRSVKSRYITKDELIHLIKTNIKTHNEIHYILTLDDTKLMREFFTEGLKKLRAYSPNVARHGVDAYLTHLSGQCQRMERERPFSSLANAHKNAAKALTDILNNIDELISNTETNIRDVRVSMFAALGVIKQSSQVIIYTAHLYTTLSKAYSDEIQYQQPYRLEFIVEKAIEVATIVSDVNAKRGLFDFLTEVDRLRRNAMDVVLVADGAIDAAPPAEGFSAPIVSYMLSALNIFNIFGLSLRAWDDYCLARNARMKETKEWLENHVALIRLKMNGVDKDSPEYKNYEKLIEIYDRKISDYDREIEEFENGD